ncbi:MAG: PIG-L family deacetylase, partial [Bacteroidia bacterium]|nr:PIG-L family deacetylase [Bacteroidia bacterium]
FASAARSNILNVMQAGILARDMQRVDRFVIYQTIGREAGWLAAATAMSRKSEEDAPHLIYCPEFHFSREKFLKDVEKCINAYGWVSIVCGEGLKYADGTAVSASSKKDKFNNTEFGAMGGASVATNLHRMIVDEFGYRGEFQITESLIMCDFVRSSEVDLDEAYRCGVEAVKLAEKGESGVMVSIKRISNKPYIMTNVFNKVALSINAHPDDAEAWNAGVLKLLKDKGYKIVIATMTGGDLGGCRMNMEETARVRFEEAKKAAAVLDAEYYTLGGVDGFLFDSKEFRLKVISLIRKVKAGVIFTHLSNDYHPDHRATANIVEAAAMESSLDPVPVDEPPVEITPLLYHSSPFTLSDPLGSQIAPPHFYVDVTSVIETKKKMLGYHVSQIDLMKHMHKIDDFFGFVLQGNRNYGKMAGVEYAEVYWQHLGGGFQKDPQVQNDLKEFLINKI